MNLRLLHLGSLPHSIRYLMTVLRLEQGKQVEEDLGTLNKLEVDSERDYRVGSLRELAG